MKTPEAKAEAVTPIPTHSRHVVEAAGGALGALGGAATGAAMGGPLGAVAGAVIGAAMGASSGWAAEKASSDQAHAEAALDDEIGVTAGSIGVSTLAHPPSKTNAPSAAALGLSSDTADSEAEGPMQAPPEG